MCVLVYKCLHQAASTYLAELCSPVSESANCGHLCSAAQVDLAVPRSRTTRYSQRCLAVSGPTLWNSLPLSVRDQSPTLTQFCARLKTVLFCRAYETPAQSLRDSLGCKDCCANTNSLTYLLIYYVCLEKEGACKFHSCSHSSVCVVSNGLPTCVCPSCSEEFQPVSRTARLSL